MVSEVLLRWWWLFDKSRKAWNVRNACSCGDGVSSRGLICASIWCVHFPCGKHCMCTDFLRFAHHFSPKNIRFFPPHLAEGIGCLHFVLWISFCLLWYLQHHLWSSKGSWLHSYLIAAWVIAQVQRGII